MSVTGDSNGNQIQNWRVLSIDDVKNIHETYAYILGCKPADDGIDALFAECEIEPQPHVSQAYSFTLDRALDGKSGFIKVKQSLEQGMPYAVILLDMRMPMGWDGLKTAKMIRSVDRDVRIILVSAYHDYSFDDIQRSFGLDFEYFRKPFGPDDLLQTVISQASAWSRLKELAAEYETSAPLFRDEGSVIDKGLPSTQRWAEKTCVNMTDRDGNLLYVNDYFCSLMGYASEELVGENHRILASGNQSSDSLIQLRESLHQGNGWTGELHRKTKDGAEIRQKVEVVPAVSDKGMMADRFIWFGYDIEDSHWLELGREAIRSYEAADRKQHLITNNILDLTKIEAGLLTIHEEPYSLFVLLKDLEHDFLTKAHDKGLDLVVKQSNEEVFRLLGDRYRIAQILRNLLENAIEFTQSGVVRLVSWRKEEHLFFSVEDTGCGMSQDQIDRIMDTVQPDEGGVLKRFGGHHLGLFISFSLAALMGGRIKLVSQDGMGTIFQFRLPYVSTQIPLVDEVKQDSEQRVERLDGKVLVVDDEELMQFLVRRHLEKTGVTVSVASNGEQAVELAVEEAFDLILMDIEMPILDGIEATRLLRKKGIQTPVIALTAFVGKSYQDRYYEAGCSGFLSKPLNSGELIYTLKQHLSHGFDVQTEEEQMISLIRNTAQDKEEILRRLSALDWELIRSERDGEVSVAEDNGLEGLLTKLESAYVRYARDEYNLVGDIETLSDQVIECLHRQPDRMIASVHLYKHFPYPIMRTVQNTIFSVLTAQRLKWKQQRIESLTRACLTQNLGHYPLQNDLFDIMDDLSDFHQMQIRLHPKRSVRALIKMGVTDRVWLQSVSYHHERMDGSGYPHGSMGKDIPLESRLMGVADRYGAMISPRKYRDAGGSDEIMRQLLSSKNRQYDIRISKALIAELGVYPPGVLVKLATGETALVTRRGESRLYPEVFAIWDPDGMPYAEPVPRLVENMEFGIRSITQHVDAGRINVKKFWGDSMLAAKEPVFL